MLVDGGMCVSVCVVRFVCLYLFLYCWLQCLALALIGSAFICCVCLGVLVSPALPVVVVLLACLCICFYVYASFIRALFALRAVFYVCVVCLCLQPCWL